MCSGNHCHCTWAPHTPQQVYLEQNQDHAPHIAERVKDNPNILSVQYWSRFHLFNPHSHPNSSTYEKMSSSQEEIIQSPSHHHNFSWGRSTITRCQILKSYQLQQYRSSLNSWTSSDCQWSERSFNRVFSSCISTRFVEDRVVFELNWKLNQHLITKHCIKTVISFLHIIELLLVF